MSSSAEPAERRARILVLGALYPPLYRGGYELLCEGVVRRAVADGHAVRILVSDFRARDSPSGEDRATVRRELRSYWDWDAERPTTSSPRERLAVERHNHRILARELADFAPDVVSWWQLGAISLSLVERVRRTATPSVLAVLDEWPIYGPRADGWLSMCRRLGPAAGVLGAAVGVPCGVDLPRAGRFLFISDHVREKVARAGLAPLAADTVHAGIHERFLSTPPAPRPWSWHLLCVGRIDPRKGVDAAIAALAHLPGTARLTVAGSGADEVVAGLRAQAARAGLGDRVTFTGPVPAGSLPALYAASDAVVFLPRWEEPFGLVPLEAMGMNRPVVAAATGGAAEYLRDGVNALLVAPDRPDEVAGALRRLAGDAELAARLRTAGRRTAEQYTAARFERRVLDALLEASGARPA